MANNTINFTINLNGTAYTGIAQIDAAMGKLNVTSKKTEKLFDRINNAAFRINNIFQATKTVVGGVLNTMKGFEDAYNVEALANKKLETVMRQRMSASEEQIDSIKRLASAQQKLGIIGDEVQTSGAQQLATFLNHTDSIKTLLPAMNNLLAQQNGLNATEGDAVNIGNLIGKVMQGQTAALTRVGITFTEAQEKVLKYGNEQQRAAMLSQVITDNVGNMNAAIAGTPEGRLAQVNNRMSDIQERIGGVYVRVKAALLPVFDQIAIALEKTMDWVENMGPTVMDIINRIGKVFSALKIPIIAVTAAVVGYKFAMLSMAAIQGIIAGLKAALAAYQIVVFAVKNSTSLWTAAQWLLNVALNMNPVALIVAGVIALIASIAYLCSKITGWSSLWKGVVGFMKYSFLAFVDAIKLYFDTYINGFLIGLDKIKLGWYKFKEAAGLGDSGENQAAIAKINADVEARQKAIVDGAKAIADNAKKAKASLGGIKMGWDSTSKLENVTSGLKAKLGINEQLQTAAGGPGTTGSTNVGGTATAKATEAVATGGTKSTNVTITLKNLVEKIVFEGTTAENKSEIERNLAEAMFRVLNMAQSSIG